ncbi:MAG: hypothetical protein IJN32_00050, partial [Thermoguttaceae bacterium]|nr:hypothetical protein [Thermoguttaceae bacterium]
MSEQKTRDAELEIVALHTGKSVFATSGVVVLYDVFYGTIPLKKRNDFFAESLGDIGESIVDVVWNVRF